MFTATKLLVMNGGPLQHNSLSNPLILFINLLNLPISLLMHGQQIAIISPLHLLLLSYDDLFQKDLVFSGDLGEFLLGAVVFGELVALVGKVQIDGGAFVQLRLFVYDVVDAFKVLLVVLLLGEGCMQAVV